jgi:hypothetical protein
MSPATRRERHRARGSPPPRSGCSSDRSGTGLRTCPRALPGTDGWSRSISTGAGRPLAIRPCGSSSPLTSGQEFGHLTHQILAFRADDRRPRHQDRVAIPDRLGDLSPCRPEHAPRSVSLHRPAHTLARDHRDPIGSGDEEQYDPFSADRPCRVEDLPDVARAHLSTFPQVRRSNERGPCGVSPRGSNGPRACACGDGSRAPSHGGGCSVGTYAFLWPWMMNLTRCDGRRGRRRHEYTGIIAG